jgi:hypothetical protein
MNQEFSDAETAKIPREIAELISLSLSQLKERWRSVYGTEPPLRSSRKLLISAIAYHMQERAFGASEDAGSRRISCTRPLTRASTGTVLIRDWQGKSHHVTVLDRGVLYRKKNYRSLSQVARVITGCRWSGPLFFGLRGRLKEGSRGTH